MSKYIPDDLYDDINETENHIIGITDKEIDELIAKIKVVLTSEQFTLIVLDVEQAIKEKASGTKIFTMVVKRLVQFGKLIL